MTSTIILSYILGLVTLPTIALFVEHLNQDIDKK